MTATQSSDAIRARLCQDLAQRLGQPTYNLWFNGSARIGMTDGVLRVAVPSRFHAEWITRYFEDALREIATSNLGPDVVLEVAVAPNEFGVAAAAETSPNGPGSNTGAPRRPRSASNGSRSAFDPRYDLERFVVSACNEMAYRAALAIAESGATFNPLFIHGGCGLGKTHLLQGVCRCFLARQPGAEVRYVTGEQFTNEFIAAIRANEIDAFRRRIRRLDLLALDDVHFLANKTQTQKEFEATFDAIGMMKARLVLASDEHPRQIRQFHQRLISRCLAGLVVEVQMPDAAVRGGLIRRWASERGLTLHPAAERVLIERCVGSVREIQGVLTQLEALAGMEQVGGEIGLILIKRLFADESGWIPGQRPVRIDRIIAAVARRFSIEPGQIVGEGRHRRVVAARSSAAWLSRRMTTLSFPEIARAMGRRNHSTIVTAVQRIEQEIDRGAEIVVTPGAAALPIQDVLDELRVSLLRDGRGE